MKMTPELKLFMAELRQHPLFPEMMQSMEQPRLKRFRPSKGDALEDVGAQHCYYSGQIDAHEKWVQFLTGDFTPVNDQTE